MGTTSVEKSERLAKAAASSAASPHEVLNAKQHEREAAIVALAGHKGAVTVATNMAGRGTDIMLGGSVEFLADQQLRERGPRPERDAGGRTRPPGPTALERDRRRRSATSTTRSTAVGGLTVLGTERHESRRIDNQLRGRSGRQGDPGESRFYLSLEDDLMRLFKSDWVDWVLQTLKVPDDVPIENKRVTGAIASAQAQVESQNFESRKNILKYDDVMSRQREVVYGERRQVLEGEDLSRAGPADDRRDGRGLRHRCHRGLPGGVGPRRAVDRVEARSTRCRSRWAEFEDEHGGREALDRDLLVDAAARRRPGGLRRARGRSSAARSCASWSGGSLLSVLDRKWREHLYEMDYLREGIGLRAYSQRDPLVEYQREGFDMFSTMMDGIKEESVGFLFNLEVQVEDEADSRRGDPLDAGARRRDADRRPLLDSSAPASGATPVGERHPQIRAKGLSRVTVPRELTYAAPTADGDAEVDVHRERVDDSATAGRRPTPGAATRAKTPGRRPTSGREEVEQQEEAPLTAPGQPELQRRAQPAVAAVLQPGRQRPAAAGVPHLRRHLGDAVGGSRHVHRHDPGPAGAGPVPGVAAGGHRVGPAADLGVDARAWPSAAAARPGGRRPPSRPPPAGTAAPAASSAVVVGLPVQARARN